MTEINDKQKAFCRALLKHKFNQTKAYMEAYPDSSKEAARASASESLTNPNMHNYLQELSEELEKQELITVEEIINDIKEVLSRCMQKEPVREYNKATKELEETGEWLFKEAGAIKALELLGKYKKLFTDKINTNIIGPVYNIDKADFKKFYEEMIKDDDC